MCPHQVCLPKSILVEKNSIATHLFLLHRGTLHVTLGEEDKNEKTVKGTRRRGSHTVPTTAQSVCTLSTAMPH